MQQKCSMEAAVTDAEIKALSIEALDALIARLGTERMKRKVPMPGEPPPIEWTTVDPAWASSLAPTGHSIIALRHNGFGWLQFALSPYDRSSIACLWLRHQIVPPNPAAPPGSPPQESGSGGGSLH